MTIKLNERFLNLNRSEMIEEIVRISGLGYANFSKIKDLKVLCQKNLKDNHEKMAIEAIKRIKIDSTFGYTELSLKKNYSKKRLVKLYENIVTAYNNSELLIDSLNEIYTDYNFLKDQQDKELKAADKTTEPKYFKALIKVNKEKVEILSNGKETRKDFILRLRKDGYTVSDRKVKEKRIFEFIMKSTNCKSNVWAYITSLTDCVGYENEGIVYINKKIEEQKERKTRK